LACLGEPLSDHVTDSHAYTVTIGMELVTDPAVLVLDEPTSGLDSYTALLLMKTLKQASRSSSS